MDATPRLLTHLPKELPALLPQRVSAQTPGDRAGWEKEHPIQGRVQGPSRGKPRLGVGSFLLT